MGNMNRNRWLIRLRIWIGAVNCKCSESMATWIRTYWAWYNWFPSTTEAVIDNRWIGNLHIRRIVCRNSPDLIRNLAEWLWKFRPNSKDWSSDRFQSFWCTNIQCAVAVGIFRNSTKLNYGPSVDEHFRTALINDFHPWMDTKTNAFNEWKHLWYSHL